MLEKKHPDKNQPADGQHSERPLIESQQPVKGDGIKKVASDPPSYYNPEQVQRPGKPPKEK